MQQHFEDPSVVLPTIHTLEDKVGVLRERLSCLATSPSVEALGDWSGEVLQLCAQFDRPGERAWQLLNLYFSARQVLSDGLAQGESVKSLYRKALEEMQCGSRSTVQFWPGEILADLEGRTCLAEQMGMYEPSFHSDSPALRALLSYGHAVGIVDAFAKHAPIEATFSLLAKLPNFQALDSLPEFWSKLACEVDDRRLELLQDFGQSSGCARNAAKDANALLEKIENPTSENIAALHRFILRGFSNWTGDALAYIHEAQKFYENPEVGAPGLSDLRSGFEQARNQFVIAHKDEFAYGRIVGFLGAAAALPVLSSCKRDEVYRSSSKVEALLAGAGSLAAPDRTRIVLEVVNNEGRAKHRALELQAGVSSFVRSATKVPDELVELLVVNCVEQAKNTSELTDRMKLALNTAVLLWMDGRSQQSLEALGLIFTQGANRALAHREGFSILANLLFGDERYLDSTIQEDIRRSSRNLPGCIEHILRTRLLSRQEGADLQGSISLDGMPKIVSFASHLVKAMQPGASISYPQRESDSYQTLCMLRSLKLVGALAPGHSEHPSANCLSFEDEMIVESALDPAMTRAVRDYILLSGVPEDMLGLGKLIEEDYTDRLSNSEILAMQMAVADALRQRGSKSGMVERLEDRVKSRRLFSKRRGYRREYSYEDGEYFKCLKGEKSLKEVRKSVQRALKIS